MEEKQIDFISLAEASKSIGYTPEYLNLRARQGKLKAVKIGRNWHTKKEWLDKFLVGIGENKTDFAETKDLKAPVKIETDEIIREVDNVIQISETAEAKNSKNNWLKVFAAMSSAVIILPLVFAATYTFKNFIQKRNAEAISSEIYSLGEIPDSQIVNENNISGKVAGEENISAGGANKSKIILASENYKIKNISVGGDIMILENGENLMPEIYDIKSESFVANKKDEVKLVIAWKTNKMAISEISYSKNNGQNSKVMQENSYGFNHGIVLADLEPRTSYVYQIKGKDRWGNEVSSGYFGIYTASKPVSVFDLISNAMGDVFGWAIKK